mgnify:CR=1 FL=1
MNIVLDTNILVSALWKPSGNASLFLSHVITVDLQLCYDHRIIEEYRDVLLRPKYSAESPNPPPSARFPLPFGA